MFTDKDPSEKGLRCKVNNYVSQMKVVNLPFYYLFHRPYLAFTSLEHARTQWHNFLVQNDHPRGICHLKTQQICKFCMYNKTIKIILKVLSGFKEIFTFINWSSFSFFFSLKVDRKETGIAVRVVGRSCYWFSKNQTQHFKWTLNYSSLLGIWNLVSKLSYVYRVNFAWCHYPAY